MFQFILLILYAIVAICIPLLGEQRLGKSRYYIDSNGIPYHRTLHRDKQTDIQVYYLALISELIRINHDINARQVELVTNNYLDRFENPKRDELTQIFQSLLRSRHVSTYAICFKLKRQISYSDRVRMVDFLMEIATIDNNYTPSENKWVLQYASALGIHQNDYNTLYYKHIQSRFSNSKTHQSQQQTSNRARSAVPRRQHTPSAYATLGLSPTATDAEVKRAYRRLAMQYHPDRMSDADAQTKANAANRFHQITQAYQLICKARRIK